MKNYIVILIFIISCRALSQSFYVFNPDTAYFPVIKAKFYALDSGGKQIINLSPSDFEVKEFGAGRFVRSVKCPPPVIPEVISAVLVMDASSSMTGFYLKIAKEAASAWIKAMPENKTESAITAFNTKNLIIQDFTNDKNILLNSVNSMFANGGTDFDEALLNPLAGGLIMTKSAKYKKIIVFLTDGVPNSEPQITRIIAEAKAQNASIYSLIIGLNAPKYLFDISAQTGGICFDNITTDEQAALIYKLILQKSQGIEPCEIEWESGLSCSAGYAYVEIKLLPYDIEANTNYKIPYKSIALLDIKPRYMKFKNPVPGIMKDSTITVTAVNSDFIITDIKTNNPAFFISPKNFTLKNGESKALTVSYLAADSGYNSSRFDFETDICLRKYYVSGGWRGKKATVRTLKLIHPNGGEVFVAGSDTVITWDGVSPDEPVTLEYRTADTEPWELVTDNGTGLSCNFRAPNIESDKYLARVTAKERAPTECDNPEVEICGQVWMGCNLDVATYRNGDSIRFCESDNDWLDAHSKKEGAWCYPDNSESLGKIYGKIYNRYAVNDKRGLAPEGWHIPSDNEWKELELCLGMKEYDIDSSSWRGTNEGGKLKAIGTIQDGDGLWLSPNTGATDETGFAAQPAGYRYFEGTFSMTRYNGYWWSSSEYFLYNSWYRSLGYSTSQILRFYTVNGYGLSVRCVRD